LTQHAEREERLVKQYLSTQSQGSPSHETTRTCSRRG
jgi:hypothetical protein